MADVFSKKKRSEVMSRIRGTDTMLEVRLRSSLFREGFRFRKNDRKLPGKPDIVLPKYNTLVFVNGCFWHGHEGCRLFVVPKTRTEFWLDKIAGNKDNDIKKHKALLELGWKIVVLWECDLKKNYDEQVEKLTRQLKIMGGNK